MISVELGPNILLHCHHYMYCKVKFELFEIRRQSFQGNRSWNSNIFETSILNIYLQSYLINISIAYMLPIKKKVSLLDLSCFVILSISGSIKSFWNNFPPCFHFKVFFLNYYICYALSICVHIYKCILIVKVYEYIFI